MPGQRDREDHRERDHLAPEEAVARDRERRERPEHERDRRRPDRGEQREQQRLADGLVVERDGEPARAVVLDRPLLRHVPVERVEPDHDERHVDERERDDRRRRAAAGAVRRDSVTERLERLQPAGDEQVADHDAIGTNENAAAVGQRLAADVVDHRADELLARDQPGRDVVAEREREREDRAGDDRRERRAAGSTRKNVVQRAAAEVGRRLEQRGRDPLEPGVDRAGS